MLCSLSQWRKDLDRMGAPNVTTKSGRCSKPAEERMPRIHRSRATMVSGWPPKPLVLSPINKAWRASVVSASEDSS